MEVGHSSFRNEQAGSLRIDDILRNRAFAAIDEVEGEVALFSANRLACVHTSLAIVNESQGGIVNFTSSALAVLRTGK